jgi:hypothetical protein
LDKELEAALGGGDDDDDGFGSFDDFDDFDDEGLGDGRKPKKAKTNAGGKKGGGGKGGGKKDAGGSDSFPPSFSRVDLSLPYGHLAKAFPLFPGVEAAAECVVEAGQMLYIPAGWFHEVTSYGDRHLAVNYWFHPPDNLQQQGGEGQVSSEANFEK